MKIIIENVGIEDFDAWSGAVSTRERILEEGKGKEFDALIEELYPNGIDDVKLNDILWFEEDWIFEALRIDTDEEDEDEDEDEDEEK